MYVNVIMSTSLITQHNEQTNLNWKHHSGKHMHLRSLEPSLALEGAQPQSCTTHPPKPTCWTNNVWRNHYWTVMTHAPIWICSWGACLVRKTRDIVVLCMGSLRSIEKQANTRKPIDCHFGMHQINFLNSNNWLLQSPQGSWPLMHEWKCDNNDNDDWVFFAGKPNELG